MSNSPHYLSQLNQVGQLLTATLDPEEVIQRLLRAVTEIIGAEGSSVWLWHEAKPGWLVCQAVYNRGEHWSLTSLQLGPGQGIAGWVAQSGQSVSVTHAPADRRFTSAIDSQSGFHTTSLLAAPLRVRDNIIGVLEVVNKLSGSFDDDDRSLVETLSASAAIAIDNARLVVALREQTADLQARNEELDAFAHTVAHDLQNPLSHMVGFAEALLLEYGYISPDEVAQHLRIIARNGRKMSNIVNELLLLASVRRQEVECYPLDMGAIVAEVVQRFAYMIEEHDAQVMVPATWPPALGYGPWVEEIWVNYVSNALKYGGHAPVLELGGTLQPEEKVRFYARDDGPGLSAGDQARVFTPFTQLAQVRVRGHGLGLSIVRRIVEKLGGAVGVESIVGQGSEFWFTLPAADVPEAAALGKESHRKGGIVRGNESTRA